MPLRFLTGAGAAMGATGIADDAADDLGRPRRFTGVPKASIARFNLSRSEINRVSICSVVITTERIALGYEAGNSYTLAAHYPRLLRYRRQSLRNGNEARVDDLEDELHGDLHLPGGSGVSGWEPGVGNQAKGAGTHGDAGLS